MKKAVGFISGTYLYLLLAKSIFAATESIPISLVPPQGSIPTIPIQQIPQFLVTLLFVFGIITAVVFLIYGGIKWILSGGDKTKVESARGHIVAAIIGLVIVAAAFFIINIAFTILTGKAFEFGKLCIPTLENPNCK